jgi:imidazoleglycerol-phosphate dehydratase
MAKSRKKSIQRKTGETVISVDLNLDGCGKATINTGIGFFDHMLNQLACHNLMGITTKIKGDLHTDAYHTVEDCGWVLGAAFAEAVDDLSGVNRLSAHG